MDLTWVLQGRRNGEDPGLTKIGEPRIFIEVEFEAVQCPRSKYCCHITTLKEHSQKYQCWFQLGLQIAFTLDSFAFEIQVIRKIKGGLAWRNFIPAPLGFDGLAGQAILIKAHQQPLRGPMHSTAMHCATGLRVYGAPPSSNITLGSDPF